MLKFKNSSTGNQNSLRFTHWTIHGSFSFCFDSSLNHCANLKLLNFICRLFHKTFRLKFDDFIPNICAFTFGIEREIPLHREYEIFFSWYVFHINLGLSFFFLICVFQWLGTAKAFDESLVCYQRLTVHHLWSCNCFTLVKF